MQHDYLNYIGSSPSDNWVKIVDHAYQSCEFGSDGNVPPSAYSWNVQPKQVAAKHDLCVRVFSEDRTNTSLPPFVNEAADIVYLEMPIRFVQNLKPGDIPASVKTLLFQGAGHFEISREIELEHIERIIAGYGALLFEKRNFPNLYYLHLRFDRRLTMLSRLPAFERLVVLSIQPCSSSMFAVLEKLPLGYLRLNNSTSETLEGIERLEMLTDLWLQRWTKITDLSPLARLPSLEDLTLSYCKRITSATAILDIPRLKRLSVWQCKNKALEALIPSLAIRDLEELFIS